MIKTEFQQIFRKGEWPNFFRLTEPLACIKVDFDYAKTRKLLDPHWDGYNIDGMDVEQDDCDLAIANLVTSRHRDNTQRHRIMLDLDYGASILTLGKVTRLRANLANPGYRSIYAERQLTLAMTNCGFQAKMSKPKLTNLYHDQVMLEVDIDHPFYFGPSSTKGHHHLILGHDIPWPMYTNLLTTLAAVGVIQSGYAKASIKRGYAALRPPWVHK